MRHGNRIRHIFFGFIRCETEHHSLVSGADGFDFIIGHLMLSGFQRFINAHGNIR